MARRKSGLTSENVLSPGLDRAGLPNARVASSLTHKPGLSRSPFLHPLVRCSALSTPPRTGRAAPLFRGEAEEAMSEAHVPTEHSPSGEEPRVPPSHVDARRSGDHRGSAAEGPDATQRLIRHAA